MVPLNNFDRKLSSLCLDRRSIAIATLLGRRRWESALARGCIAPVDRAERSQLDRVSHQCVLHLDQTVAASHHAAQLVAGVCHWYQCLGAGSGASLLTIHHAHCHQLIGGQRAGLVKQAVAYFAARGDAEWLRAKDVCLVQGHQGCLDCQACLHWQLRRHNRGEDEHAAQEQLVLGAALVLQALVQHIAAAGAGKAEQQRKQRGCLHLV
mmetsp:Transcript_17947/g.46008  ORF Transcript_17947/g.46008 Transcript_17947/m.46008 type:complete len:209 (+) Transcript_17947:2605-3231(+)